MILHFLSFKLVTWLACSLSGEPYLLAAFPIYGQCLVAYTAAGLVLPLWRHCGVQENKKYRLST